MTLQKAYLIIIGAENISVLCCIAIEFLAIPWYNKCR
nr:MAG TPA: hypothetical protein [Caudoviricetes sp.]